MKFLFLSVNTQITYKTNMEVIGTFYNLYWTIFHEFEKFRMGLSYFLRITKFLSQMTHFVYTEMNLKFIQERKLFKMSVPL